MSETLSYRVGRLVSGGFHAILDKAEDLAPEIALNESVREIERATAEVRAELGKVLAQKHLASKKMLEENGRHEALTDSIHTALAKAKEDLAQVGIAEQMDIEARLVVLENTIIDCLNKEQELESFITALQAKRREMLNAIADLQKAKATASTPNLTVDTTGMANHVNKSTQVFDRIMARQTGLHLNEPSPKTLADLQELETLSRNNRIAERLAKLKAEQS